MTAGADNGFAVPKSGFALVTGPRRPGQRQPHFEVHADYGAWRSRKNSRRVSVPSLQWPCVREYQRARIARELR